MLLSNKSLLEAFRLLDGFAAASPAQKKKRIEQVNRLLKCAEGGRRDANLALRTIDQLRKQRVHMLITAGKLNEGIAESKRIVRDYEASIASLHDEAAFQLAEAALNCFRNSQMTRGFALTLSALAHAGNARSISKTLLSALEIAQREQAKRSTRGHSGRHRDGSERER